MVNDTEGTEVITRKKNVLFEVFDISVTAGFRSGQQCSSYIGSRYLGMVIAI